MPGDSFDFGLGLTDDVSGPAAAEARALKGLATEIGTVEGEIKKLIVQQRALKSAGLGGLLGGSIGTVGKDISLARKELSELRRQQKELGGDVGDRGGGLGFIGKIFLGTSLAYGVRRVGEEILRANSAIRQFVISAGEFKEAAILEYGGGDVTAGNDIFGKVQSRALETHLPVEEAHKLARDLRLQGLEDADLITATIQSNAELIRTGQLSGAAKLKNIIEKSIASGHFDVRGLGGGKGGAEGSARALAGLGINQKDLLADLAVRYKTDVAHIKAMLKQGKIETEVGLAAIDQAISAGPIGRAARKKFGFEEFKTDVFNKLTVAAQNVDLTKFNQSLVDAAYGLGLISEKGGPIESIFQGMVDGAAKAIEQLSVFGIDFQADIIDWKNKGKEFSNWLVDHHLGWLVGASGKDAGEHGSILDTYDVTGPGRAIGKAAIPAVGNAINALPDSGFFGAIKDRLLNGPPVDENTPAWAKPGASADSVKIPGMAGGGVVGQPKAPDSVFAAVEPGETILPRGFFEKSGAIGGGGKQVHVEFSGNVYVGAHVDADTARATWMAAFTEVSEQFALELGTE